MEEKKIKEVVKDRYSQIAKQDQPYCCSGCACGISPLTLAEAVGYLAEDLEHVPAEALMGWGVVILPL